MRWRTTVSLVAGAALGICAACAEEPPRHVSVRLLAPEALSCRATELSRVRVEPRGDFPASQRPSVAVVPGGPPVTTDLFDPGTEHLLVFAEGLVRNAAGSTVPWVGGGRARIDDREEVLVPLLPFGRSCLLADDDVGVPMGAATLGLPDGRVFIAGGSRNDAALATVTLVTPGERLADPDTLRLFSPRTATAAVELGELVLVVGGSGSEGGIALDAIEAMRVRRGAEARVGQGFLSEARRRPAVVRVAADAALVIGGEDGGRALGSAERLRVSEEGASIESVPLADSVLARWGASVLTLDDGTVVVVGGRDEDGAVGGIERLEDGELRLLGGVAPVEGARWVALLGARFARITPAGEVRVWLDRGETSEVLGSIAPALFETVAHAEPDGRVLVAGLDSDSNPFAQRIDLGGSRASETLSIGRAPSVIVPLADGTLVLGDAERLALLRVDLSSALDDPPATIFPAQPDQRRHVVLDLPSRWAVADGVLRARTMGARWHVPRSRFADLRVEFEAVGAVELLLCPEGAACEAIGVDESSVRYRGCTIPRPDGPVVVTRSGERLTLGESAECAFAVQDRVSIAVAAAEGAGVRSIAIERL